MTVHLLRIYQAPSGQWSGIVFEDGDETARIAGCASPGEVEDTVRETWPGIQIEPSEDARAFWASFEGQPNTDVEFALYYDRRDPEHVRVLCAAHGAEHVARGWAPGTGKLGHCELPEPPFCAACREAGQDTALSRQ